MTGYPAVSQPIPFDLSGYPGRLAVVCHDAGAANLILAWLQSAPHVHAHYYVQGPAQRIKDSLQIPGANAPSLMQAIANAEAVLSGTGWQTDLEHSARMLAREQGKLSIAVIDHWVNYRERFVQSGQSVWPDEFWVTDQDAYSQASICFPGQHIVLKPNLYLQQQPRQIKSRETSFAKSDVLYVLEPTRSNWGNIQPGEFQALDFFMKHRGRVGIPEHTRIRLRPHPSEAPGKYDGWISMNKQANVVLDQSMSLVDAMASAHWVVGCETYAMVLAMESGRMVVSTLPPWAPPCRLPHRQIIKLNQLLS